MTATLERNFQETRNAIAHQSEGCGRQSRDVKLIAVTKSVGPELALGLANMGQTDLGENRLPSLQAKREYFAAQGVQAVWHFIGHIQRNKARRVLEYSDVLHSVDTLQLIDTLERIAGEENRTVPIFLEVKLSNEAEKHGFQTSQLNTAIERAGAAEHLELLGLMTMAARPKNPEPTAPPEFDELAKLAAECTGDPARRGAFKNGQVLLSMGMSADFAAAIAAGSHMVRIGSALFRGLSANGQEQGEGR